MEFHDVLHGQIVFRDETATAFLRDLITSPEINRLRNMRQMNFDVPLIQELGRSRRLPHSIGVTYVANQLAEKSGLSILDKKELLAAAILHDAAIPPYGHLVESEFKSAGIDFKHEKRVEELIRGTIGPQNKYMAIVPGKPLRLSDILDRHHVDPTHVIELICPVQRKTPISADIDLDNIDNVHRMAIMLGWEGARENLRSILEAISLQGLGEMMYSKSAHKHIERWLDYRQRIYTMIIGHPECVPYNALQSDLVRLAVSQQIISPRDWFLSEPIFEELLRSDEATKSLATQLISGCDYQLIDYAWFKNFSTDMKITNGKILKIVSENVSSPQDFGYFVWNEKGLVSRRVRVSDENGNSQAIGQDSSSCMIALVKKTSGKPRWTKASAHQWRKDVTSQFVKLFAVNQFEIDYPETFTGNFLGQHNNELKLGYY